MTGTTGQSPREGGRKALGAGEEMAGGATPPGKTTGAGEQHCGWPLLCLLPHNLRSFLIFSPLTQVVDNPLPHSQRRHRSGKAMSAGFASRFEQLEKHSVGLIGWFICYFFFSVWFHALCIDLEHYSGSSKCLTQVTDFTNKKTETKDTKGDAPGCRAGYKFIPNRGPLP